jgi:hypothetical protein
MVLQVDEERMGMLLLRMKVILQEEQQVPVPVITMQW